jgi:hypothetical protein
MVGFQSLPPDVLVKKNRNKKIAKPVVEHDSVGAHEVDAQTTTARRQNEAKDTRVFVEAIHHLLPPLHGRRAIQPEIRLAMEPTMSFIREKL